MFLSEAVRRQFSARLVTSGLFFMTDSLLITPFQAFLPIAASPARHATFSVISDLSGEDHADS